jgi:hypothetical protein
MIVVNFIMFSVHHQLFMQVSYSDHFANMWTKVTEETEVYANRSS